MQGRWAPDAAFAAYQAEIQTQHEEAKTKFATAFADWHKHCEELVIIQEEFSAATRHLSEPLSRRRLHCTRRKKGDPNNVNSSVRERTDSPPLPGFNDSSDHPRGLYVCPPPLKAGKLPRCPRGNKVTHWGSYCLQKKDGTRQEELQAETSTQNTMKEKGRRLAERYFPVPSLPFNSNFAAQQQQQLMLRHTEASEKFATAEAGWRQHRAELEIIQEKWCAQLKRAEPAANACTLRYLADEAAEMADDAEFVDEVLADSCCRCHASPCGARPAGRDAARLYPIPLRRSSCRGADT